MEGGALRWATQEIAAMPWGHYDILADNVVFIYFVAAWTAVAADSVQQLKRWDKKRKERAEWKEQ